MVILKYYQIQLKINNLNIRGEITNKKQLKKKLQLNISNKCCQ